ncbi:MAG: two-component system sensor histidine kinase NtrB [Thermoanaerobaculia bacterium]
MESLRRSLRVLTAIRLIVVGAIVLSAILLQATAGAVFPLAYLFGLAGLAALLSMAYVLLRRVLQPTGEAYVQLCGDLVIVTLLVYFSGGAESIFSFLYLVVIAATSFLLLRSGSLLVASLASILYGLMVELTAYDVIPPSPLSSRPEWVGPTALFNMCFNIAAFYGVALLTSLMAEKLHLARKEITARRLEFERIQALHGDVIESMSSGVATIDREGRFTFLNRAGAEILRTGTLESRGTPVWNLGLFDPAQWRGMLEGLETDESGRGEMVVGSPEKRTLGYSLRKLRGTEGLLLLFQDLTELKKLEEEARSREKLAAVGQLAAGIAHEIRNPLASISGSAQLLGNEMRSGSSERRLMEIIVSESRRLSAILEDFLRYARPRPKRAEPFDIAASLTDAMHLFSNSHEITEKHRLCLQIEPGNSRVCGDPDHIRQIFWNVAKNAVCAMPAGGTLDVTGRDEGTWYAIRFRDSGRGMTPERKEMLFQPFAASFEGGTGLGMAIVRRLVDEHGGQIFVETEVGAGTQIEIRLPRGGAEVGSSAA